MYLIIDNYDSFTYNLAQVLGTMGQKVLVYRNDSFTMEELECLSPQAVIISPGPGEPFSAGLSLQVVGLFKERLPLLGICLGHQVIGSYFGGEIRKASRLMHGKTSFIYHNGDSIFQGIDSPFVAMRYHSLLLDKNTLPASLEVIAATEDGEIMGIRHKVYRNLVGLQFHPESFFTPCGRVMLANFCSSFPRTEAFHPQKKEVLTPNLRGLK